VNKRRSRMLEEIPRSGIDPQMLMLLDELRQADGVVTSFVRGVVTGQVWVVHHTGRWPKRFVRQAEAEEIAALPTVGGVQ